MRLERSAASASLPAPGLSGSSAPRSTSEPDDQRPGDLGEAAERAVEQRRPGVAGRQEEALGDQHRQRHREADDRQPQRDGRSSSRRGAPSRPSARTAVGAVWLLRMPSAAARPISGAVAACQAARGRAGRVHAREAVDQGAGGDRALGRGVEAELDDQRERRSGPRAGSRGGAPGPARPGRSRSSGEARSRRARPGGVEERLGRLAGRHGR